MESEMPNWFSHRIHQSNWGVEAVEIHPGPIVSLSVELHRRRDWYQIYLTSLCQAEWMMSVAGKYLICSGDTGPQTNFPATFSCRDAAVAPAPTIYSAIQKGPAAATHRILIIERTRVPGGDQFGRSAPKMHRNRCVACPTTVAFNHTSLWPSESERAHDKRKHHYILCSIKLNVAFNTEIVLARDVYVWAGILME